MQRGGDHNHAPPVKSDMATTVTTITMTTTTTMSDAKKKRRYADRTNAGEVVTSYSSSGTWSVVPEEEDAGGGGGRRRAADIVVLGPPRSSGRHMFAPLKARSDELERRLIHVDATIRGTYGIRDEDKRILAQLDGMVKEEREWEGTANHHGENAGGYSTWTPVGLPKQHKVLCVGRICNEAHEGRLNLESVMLEGSRRHSMGSRIKLDLSGLLEHNGNKGDAGIHRDGYSFFPGQIVAVEGINPTGRTMRVTRVIEGVVPPPPQASIEDVASPTPSSSSSPYSEEKDAADADDDDRRALSIWTACGPYTLSNDLEYDPFLDLVERVVAERPDVVILCGPFVDGRQSLVIGEGGIGPRITDDDDNDDNAGRLVTTERLFAMKVSSLLAEMYETVPDAKTQFVLVPSLEDAFLDAVYPQPPIEDDNGRGEGAGRRDPRFTDLGLSEVETAGRRRFRPGPNSPARRVHLVSNPCTLSINGVVVGVTSTDILLHLASEGCEASLPSGLRLARLAGHLVRQGSYYPLFPPVRGTPLDMTKAREWEISVRPDLLVVPSKLVSFARPAEDGHGETLVVNPGELTKGTSGGTYASIVIRPKILGRRVNGTIITEKTSMSGNDGPGSAMATVDGRERTSRGGIMDRVRVEVRRI